MTPTLVNEELTTVEFKVVPDNVPAGATTAFPLAAVIKPFAFTVNEGIEVEEPKLPTFELTVASVVANEPALVVISPVSAGNCPACKVPEACVVKDTVPESWEVDKLKLERVVKVLFEVAVIFAAFPEILPDTCEPESESEERVVNVELLVAVILAAVPEVLAALFGISSDTSALKLG